MNLINYNLEEASFPPTFMTTDFSVVLFKYISSSTAFE